MAELMKLPDAEFELMKLIWEMPPPVTSMELAARLPDDLQWKPQTILTLLGRMEKRGLLRSRKEGKERLYYPVVGEDEYMSFEASLLRKRYRNHSLASFVGSLYGADRLKEEEILDLEQWLEAQKKR